MVPDNMKNPSVTNYQSPIPARPIFFVKNHGHRQIREREKIATRFKSCVWVTKNCRLRQLTAYNLNVAAFGKKICKKKLSNIYVMLISCSSYREG